MKIKVKQEIVITCPIDCKGHWSDWSECSQSCSGGTQHRTFVIENENYTGKSCSFVGGYVEMRSCSNTPLSNRLCWSMGNY